MSQKKQINIIEIDIRDMRFQSGIARYFDILAENMPENIKTFRVIFYHSPDMNDIKISQTENELSIYHPAGYPGGALFDAALVFVGAKIDAMDNLIVKSNCLGAEGFATMIRSRFYCKTIGVLHCLPHRGRQMVGFPPVSPFKTLDHVILVCEHGREFLDGVKEKRPHSIICNGIADPKPNVKKKTDDVFRFIFANGWAPHKGFAKIIPAIRAVAETHKIEVVIMGGTIPDEKIDAEIAGLPIIKTGLITDPAVIASHYENADCALFASESEACSFAGIEALAYNLPIVSTDAPGLDEMFGRAALFVKMDDKKELNTDEYAAEMIRVIESKSLRTKLAILAYARYREKYTAKKMARDTIDLYNRLV